MSATNNTPTAPASETPYAPHGDQGAPVDEKSATETTHEISAMDSQTSLDAATMIASPDSREKDGYLATAGSTTDLRRPSDLSTPMLVKSSNPFDTDIEAMISPAPSGAHLGRRSVTCRGLADSQVWPGQSHWKRKAREQKIKRSQTCLSRLSKRNRLLAKIIIVLFIVGVAVGVGLGISKSVGAPIWGQHNS